jgi:hypothetical protein
VPATSTLVVATAAPARHFVAVERRQNLLEAHDALKRLQPLRGPGARALALTLEQVDDRLMDHRYCGLSMRMSAPVFACVVVSVG